MNKLLTAIRELLVKLTRPAIKTSQTAPCEFCGRPGHTADDCPDAAKFKLFSVDHDSEPDH